MAATAVATSVATGAAAAPTAVVVARLASVLMAVASRPVVVAVNTGMVTAAEAPNVVTVTT